MLTHTILSLAGRIFGKNKLSIMIYHQVLAELDPMRPSEPLKDTFRWQMQWVKKYYHPLSISSALKHLKNGTLPKNAVCITFDDGYINNLVVAAPILKELNIPATVYIATAFSGGENMWNDRIIDLVTRPELSDIDLAAIDLPSEPLSDTNSRIAVAHMLIKKIKYREVDERKTLINQLYIANKAVEAPRRMMSPAQIKALDELGVEIGAHTVDHPILTVLDAPAQREQISQSKKTLEACIGKPVNGFAYPNGKLNRDYDSVTRDIVADLNFDYAVSTNWGISTVKSDKFQLNRFTPWDLSPLKFHLRFLRNLLAKD